MHKIDCDARTDMLHFLYHSWEGGKDAMQTITLDVPDDLAVRLRVVEKRLPNILELGLRQFYAQSQIGFDGAAEILELLASLPTPEAILAIHPSDAFQSRIDALLEKNREEGLTVEEDAEWERYMYLEHLVRMAKAKALVSSLSVEDDLSPSQRAELAVLALKSDEQLRSIASAFVDVERQTKLEELATTQKTRPLVPDERIELDRLLDFSYQFMLRKAEAVRLLALRGHKIFPQANPETY